MPGSRLTELKIYHIIAIAGVTADLDPPGPNPLADMDPLSRIWTPLKPSALLSKIGKIVFWRQNKNIEAVFLFK